MTEILRSSITCLNKWRSWPSNKKQWESVLNTILTVLPSANRHIGEINETDMNYYNLKENLIIQGYKITIIIMSWIIAISSVILFLY